MSKELFVSSTPHETKVAIVEEDQLTEVYYERENEYTLAGSIYKGRVTRVLPGMQSAFVNVGLERDAFLYVSDFLLEEEDDDTDAIEQVVSRSRHEVHVISEPRQETHQRPLEADEIIPAAEGFEAAEFADVNPAEASAEAEGSAESGDREGTRRWRGRRRRGRGRDRFQDRGGDRSPDRSGDRGQERGPERSAEPAGERPEHAAEQQVTGTEELGAEPGEQHPAERTDRGPERSDRGPDRGDRGFERSERGHDRGRQRFSERPQYERRPAESFHESHAPQPGYEPIVLPGESISKYQPQSAAQEKPEAVTPAAPQHRPKPSTEYVVDASQFSAGSMTLPGESISKYKHDDRKRHDAHRHEQRPAPETMAVTTTLAEPEPQPFAGQPTAEPEQHASFEEHSQGAYQPHQESQAGAAHHEAASTKALHVPAVTPAREEHPPRQPAAHEAPSHEPAQSSQQDEQRRMENMNVASVFGGGALEPQEETQEEETTEETFEHPSQQVRAANYESQETESISAIPAAEQHSSDAQAGNANPWSKSSSGTVEEEEIEEEESELLSAFEEHLDAAEFDDFEEEDMARADRQMVHLGGELTEAVRDAHVNEHATGQYEGDGLEGSEDFEESEGFEAAGDGDDEEGDEGDEGDGADESEEPEEGRAAMRAPAGTAGYQQRTERKSDDRRNRKFGRRMRGRPRPQMQRHLPAISDLLKEGQEILVQIAKEPIAKKGARITSHIALPGRFLVYMPTVHHTGVSRKIASDEERQRLKRIVLSERGDAHGGFIVRTAASGANEEDLRADIRFLINLWNEIRGRAEKSKAPSLIYHDLNLVERILRDQVSVNFSSIWADTEQEYERIVRFVSRFQPSLLKRVKLYTKETPLFEQFNITDEINKALKSKVWLKSGGYIVINQTEALVAIDINTGKYVGKTARLEDTIVKTNIDAIKEIVRQIRLRDLGGIIVIDFIDMDERRNRQKVMQALEEAMKADRAPSKVLQFNDFGLVAITRKRVKQSLERTLGQQCTVCTGTGMIKSVTTICNEIYVEMRKMARHFEHDVMVRVNPEVAKALKANNGRWIEEMEELTRRTLLVKSDPLLHIEQFDIQ
jgi:ribonuclease G